MLPYGPKGYTSRGVRKGIFRSMDANLFKQLLAEGESSRLDYKSRQYRFVGASDDQKSELLKDVLAMANAWRDSDAYILLGVQEVRRQMFCMANIGRLFLVGLTAG